MTTGSAVDWRLTNVARIYDALLGGRNNLAVDREAARQITELIPDAPRAAQSNREFLVRAVGHLAGRAGVSQFVDIGTGLPTGSHVHQVAQSVNRDARVVYADNDPTVISHARGLLSQERSVMAVEADARYPGELLTMREITEFIDFSQPVAVLLVAILHFIHDSERPWSAVKSITDYLAPGSYLVLSHVTGDNLTPEVVQHANSIYNRALVRSAPRSHAEIMRFFDGLEMMPPGLVDVADWRPGHCARPDGRPVLFWAGVGTKPHPADMPASDLPSTDTF